MLDIYTLGEDVLRTKAEKITDFDQSLSILVDAMFDTMDEADGVGLAAPQIGVSKRIFVIDTRKDKERIAFVNPVIIETSQNTVSYEEGCLSIPTMYTQIVRPAEVTVQAQDVKGKSFVLKATGLLARAIQHEYDHLEGVLFIDRMEQQERDALVAAYQRRQKKRKHK
ncbi:MAG: peptide deformylase [Sphaerochaetaceae bacterium]|jgi:peptide deformylase|nr:peptide deformylase [Sphaerochaetaceae bacterium]MDX9809261.1 peptide deformylase [Sphaerochaetaceae bacterium]